MRNSWKNQGSKEKVTGQVRPAFRYWPSLPMGRRAWCRAEGPDRPYKEGVFGGTKIKDILEGRAE